MRHAGPDPASVRLEAGFRRNDIMILEGYGIVTTNSTGIDGFAIKYQYAQGRQVLLYAIDITDTHYHFGPVMQ